MSRMAAPSPPPKRSQATNPETDHFSQDLTQAHAVSGPIPFLNPTTRLFPARTLHPPAGHPEDAAKTRRQGRPSNPERPAHAAPGSAPGPEGTGDHDVWHVWRSRDNRKGRHAVAVTPDYHHAAKETSPGHEPPRATVSWLETLSGLGRMVTRYPVWDISYDVAVIFTWGSVIWVINGFFVLLPLIYPASAFPGESGLGGGITAFVGASVFEIGSVLLLLEAVNENREACFGWALHEELELHSGRPHHVLRRHETRSQCRHSHCEKRSLVSSPKKPNSSGLMAAHDTDDSSGKTATSNSPTTDSSAARRWDWWPTTHELRTHYIRDLGFLASATQMVAATIFWIAGLTGLPPIYDNLSVAAADGAYWMPQVVGGFGFIVSGALFMIETQEKWWKPAPRVLGWHIGFWNCVGAVGFTLCGALGFGEGDAIEYALTLATFIGSWAFLIGSVIQWYESLAKYPMTVEKKLPATS